jgi:hypothetical protein
MVPVRVNYGKVRQKYAKGGQVAKQAENVRAQGRMGDDMVVHVNKREFDEMCQRWGKPTINPQTNLPEFFLGDLFGGLGDLLSGGVGLVSDTAGDWLANNPGVTQAIGSGLLGAGAGQLLGGNTKSTLIGGGLGALAPSLLGGAGLFGSMAGSGKELADSDNVFKSLSGDLKEAGVEAGGGAAKSGLAGMLGNKNVMAPLIGGLMLANVLGGMGKKGPSKAEKKAAADHAESKANFNRKLPPVEFNRAFTPFQGNPMQYGMGGQGNGQWFTGNQAPLMQPPAIASAPQRDNEPQRLAKGGAPMQGALSQFVQGPGGAREDKIPALLSNNEYIIDAETTALLGDGDPAMGAKKLDAMRENIRKHKGKSLARGKISPDARPAAESYMGARK